MDAKRVEELRALKPAAQDKAPEEQTPDITPVVGMDAIMAKRTDILQEQTAIKKRQQELESEMAALRRQYLMTLFKTMNIEPLPWKEVDGEPAPTRTARREHWTNYNSIMAKIKAWREDVDAGKEKDLPRLIDLSYIAALHQKEKQEPLASFESLPKAAP